jgi:hypothetical protein
MAKRNFDPKHREYLRQKMILRNKQNIGKTYEEIYGIKKAKERKNQISRQLTGRKMSEKNKQILINISKNKIVSQETRNKLSETRKKLGLAKGKNNPLYGIHNFGSQNPNWNGGLSFLPYSEEFNNALKNKIRQRDDHTCQICLVKNQFAKFPIHHIDYDKENCNHNNLITVCNYCHGKTNKSRTSWKSWFFDLISIKYENQKVYKPKNHEIIIVNN